MSKLAHAGASTTTLPGAATPNAVRTALPISAASCTVTVRVERLVEQRARLADRDHRRLTVLQRRGQLAEIAALEAGRP